MQQCYHQYGRNQQHQPQKNPFGPFVPEQIPDATADKDCSGKDGNETKSGFIRQTKRIRSRRPNHFPSAVNRPAKDGYLPDANHVNAG